MSVVVSRIGPELTAGEEDAQQTFGRFDEDPPPDAVLHTAWWSERGLSIVEVWRSGGSSSGRAGAA
jgi:hypothetical protein